MTHDDGRNAARLELRALTKLGELLEELDADARARVLRYHAERLGLALVHANDKNTVAQAIERIARSLRQDASHDLPTPYSRRLPHSWPLAVAYLDALPREQARGHRRKSPRARRRWLGLRKRRPRILLGSKLLSRSLEGQDRLEAWAIEAPGEGEALHVAHRREVTTK